VPRCDEPPGEVLDADIVLNGKYQLGLVAKGTTHPALTDAGGQTYDIGRVLAHEMGHALALSDEPADDSALMYPYVSRAVSLSTTPAGDDLAGLSTLYGGSTGATHGDAASNRPSSSAGGCAVAAAPRALPLSRTSMGVAAGLALAALAMAGASRVARTRRGAAGCTAFAAVALFVPPSTSAPVPPRREMAAWFEAKGTVTKVTTTSVNGLFRSEIDVATTSCATADCPPAARFVTWGGTVGHVRQEIGGVRVPDTGDAVSLVLDPHVIRTMTRTEN
jgi:hypothetical protein